MIERAKASLELESGPALGAVLRKRKLPLNCRPGVGLTHYEPAGPVSDSFLFESGLECVFVSKSRAAELAGESEDLDLGSLEVGEAAQCWTREVTVTRLA